MPSHESLEIRKTIVKDALRDDVSIQEQRQEWESYALSLPLPKGIKCKEETFGNVPCLWVRDAQSHKKRVIVYVHGGGLVEGSPLTHREFAARIVEIIHIPVLLVEYRLAPEYPYPAGLQDVLVVYRALLGNGVQSGQMIFAGDSSGGGLALAALLKLRDDGVPLPAAAFLISGVFDCTFSGESMETRAELDPFTSRDVLAHCCHLYVDGEDVRSPLISPLYANLSNLPPLLLQVGDHEILLSDSLRLAEKIKRFGGEVRLSVWDSMWHVWPMYSGLPEAREAIEEIRDFIYQALRMTDKSTESKVMPL